MVLRATTHRLCGDRDARNLAPAQMAAARRTGGHDLGSPELARQQRRRAQGRPMEGPRRTACLQPRPRSARPHRRHAGATQHLHPEPAPRAGQKPPSLTRADLTCGGPACGTSTPGRRAPYAKGNEAVARLPGRAPMVPGLPPRRSHWATAPHRQDECPRGLRHDGSLNEHRACFTGSQAPAAPSRQVSRSPATLTIGFPRNRERGPYATTRIHRRITVR